MNPVWIIDDDRSIRWVFEKALAREGIAHRTFGAAKEALDRLPEETPQVVVTDIRMPGVSGLDLMQQLKGRIPSTPVIIMTAYSDLDSAVAAFQGGAFEYLPKPFDVDHAVELVRRAMDESLRQVEAPPAVEEAPEILGQAPAMQEVFRAIGRLAQSQATVLITGESGTGKELVARALGEEVARERGNVVAAFAQRGKPQADHVQAVIEIFAKRAFAHALLEVLVGGGDHAHVGLDLLMAADAIEAAVREDAQKPRLQLRRHVADLVEKERAAFGLLEAPAPLLLRAGERTALMAEELRFQQVLGHRRGIDGDKRLGRARAMTVQRARHQLLAGA